MKLGLVGAGNMASALARGIGEPVLVHDVDADKAKALADQLGGEAADRTRVVVSILAATSTERLAAAYPGAAIYRFIPNMPMEIKRGVLCYVAGPGASEGPEDEILELMGRAGAIIRLDDEPLIEPAMALMSCGPAFMALVAESFAEAGAAHGLDPDDAMRMVAETMGGTADYLAQHGYDGPGLRARVATPGGVTEKGLITLEERGLGEVCRAAVDTVVEATR